MSNCSVFAIEYTVKSIWTCPSSAPKNSNLTYMHAMGAQMSPANLIKLAIWLTHILPRPSQQSSFLPVCACVSVCVCTRCVCVLRDRWTISGVCECTYILCLQTTPTQTHTQYFPTWFPLNYLLQVTLICFSVPLSPGGCRVVAVVVVSSSRALSARRRRTDVVADNAGRYPLVQNNHQILMQIQYANRYIYHHTRIKCVCLLREENISPCRTGFAYKTVCMRITILLFPREREREIQGILR